MKTSLSILTIALALTICQSHGTLAHAESAKKIRLSVTISSNCTTCRISAIDRKSTAFKAGLRVGDVLLRLNDMPLAGSLTHPGLLADIIADTPTNATVPLQVLRKRKGIINLSIPGEKKPTAGEEHSISSPVSTIDPLPWNAPKTSLLVLGSVTPVIFVCNNQKKVTMTGDAGSVSYIREMRQYDMATKSLVATLVNNGKDQWYAAAYDKPTYERWLLKPGQTYETSQPDFSMTHRIGFKKDCDGVETPLSYFLTPAAITDIRSSGPDAATVAQGQDRTIGAFTVVSTLASPDNRTHLKSMRFLLSATAVLTISNIRIVAVKDGVKITAPCLYNNPPYVVCEPSALMDEITGDVTYTVLADITKKRSEPATLQLKLSDFGTPFEKGSVLWSNDTESFAWMSPPASVVKGTLNEIIP